MSLGFSCLIFHAWILKVLWVTKWCFQFFSDVARILGNYGLTLLERLSHDSNSKAVGMLNITMVSLSFYPLFPYISHSLAFSISILSLSLFLSFSISLFQSFLLSYSFRLTVYLSHCLSISLFFKLSLFISSSLSNSFSPNPNPRYHFLTMSRLSRWDPALSWMSPYPTTVQHANLGMSAAHFFNCSLLTSSHTQQSFFLSVSTPLTPS